VDIPFYATASVFGYLILLGLPNMPWYLGGSGECRNNYLEPMHFRYRSGMVNGFYILQCGQHLYSFVAHLFDKSSDARQKFYETFLHHSLSIMLIMMSYLNNQTLVGIMVLFLHDCSDTLLLLARFYGDLRDKYKPLLYGIYGVCFPTWVYLRLVSFPLCCIYEAPTGVAVLYSYAPQFQSALLLPGLFMILMMLGLMVMHLFWTYFIFSAMGNLFTKKKVSITRSY
jgi:hypothetical protein